MSFITYSTITKYLGDNSAIHDIWQGFTVLQDMYIDVNRRHKYI